MDRDFTVYAYNSDLEPTYDYTEGNWYKHPSDQGTAYCLGTVPRIVSDYPQPEDTLYQYQP